MKQKQFEQLIDYLINKINEYRLETYNESTFNWSRGYIRALSDILEFILDLKNNQQSNKPE